MAIIYECDGCDDQTKDSRKIKSVEVEIKSDQGQGPTIYHLCASCESNLRGHANPNNWAREALTQ